MTINTHEAYKKMIDAGLPSAQAEAIVELFKAYKEQDMSKFATEEQIALINQQSKDKIDLLEQKFDNKLTLIEAKMSDNFLLNTQKHQDTFNIIEQKIEFSIAKLETRMAKQDSIQKTWLMGVVLAILGVGTAIILRITFS